MSEGGLVLEFIDVWILVMMIMLAYERGMNEKRRLGIK